MQGQGMAHMMMRGTGSGTQTLQVQKPSSSDVFLHVETVTLRLVRRDNKKVRWRADTIDNELMHKKKSNKCCIYHKESLDESSGSEEEEEEEDSAKGKGKKQHHHHHHHDDEVNDDQISTAKRPDQEPPSTGAPSDMSVS